MKDEHLNTSAENIRNQGYKVSVCLNVTIILVLLISATILVFSANYKMKNQSLIDAESKAMLLLNRNLATHHYFTKNLKPAIFKLSDPFRDPDYFEPSWMSSTYAVREGDR